MKMCAKAHSNCIGINRQLAGTITRLLLCVYENSQHHFSNCPEGAFCYVNGRLFLVDSEDNNVIR